MARLLLEKASDHDQTVVNLKSLPFPLSSREFLVRSVCFQGDARAGTFGIAASYPTNGDSIKVDYGTRVRKVRSKFHTYFAIVPLEGQEDGQCEISIFTRLSSESSIASQLVEKKVCARDPSAEQTHP
jgi:hypothetical protein